MIVDLMRNDLGRIARPGSVRVERSFEAERYATVWQMTSTDLGDCVTAPVGGDPRRAVSLRFGDRRAEGRNDADDRDLEPSPRGVYSGAIGYLAPPGSDEPRARFNVAIRTAVHPPASPLGPVRRRRRDHATTRRLRASTTRS